MSRTETSLAVLFADAVGSSHLYEQLGDTAARKLLADGIQLLTDIVHQYSGTLIKTIGDEIMATFPNADLGVQAGIFMQKMIDQTQLDENAPAGSLHIKVGLHFGPVIQENNDVFGNTVNVASRVASQAKSQQILTTKQTIESLSTKDMIQSRFIEKAALKGIDELCELHEIIYQDDASDSVTANLSDDLLEHLLTPASLELSCDGKKITVGGSGKRSISLGRHIENDLVVSGEGISRLHAKIEFNRNKFTIKDQSINGTFVIDEKGNVNKVHRDEFILEGEGCIFLGIKGEPDSPLAIKFKRTGH